MPAAFERWKVLPHGPVEKLTDDLWCVEGALPNQPFRRKMTLARLPDGRLIIHNGVALEAEHMSAIESWGTPAFLLVPNAWHRLDARVFKDRYPDIEVLCPEGARKRVSAVVPVNGTYDDLPANDRAALEHLDGVKRREGVMRLGGA